HISNPNVKAFTQDKEGFLWIGTVHGLNRFDGYNYVTFYTTAGENGLPNDNIQGLLTDSQGNVWISSECGLTKWEKEAKRFRHLEFPIFTLYSQLQDIDNEYIAACNRGKIVLVNKINFHEDYQFSLPHSFEPIIVGLPQQKQIWATGDSPDNNHTITILSQKLEPLGSFQAPGEVRSMQADQAGNIWIKSSQGIFLINGKDHSLIENELTRFCKGKNVLFLHTNQPEVLAVGIQNEGMFWYDIKKQKITPVTVRQTLSGNHWSSFLDKKGTLWLNDQIHEMVCYPKDDSYETIHLGKRGLNDYYILTIESDKQGNLWARSTHDFIGMNPHNQEIFYHDTGNFGEFILTSDQQIWLITGNRNQIVRAKIQEKTLLQQQSWKTEEIILSICQNNKGEVWIATSEKLGLLKENGTISWINGPKGTTIRGLYEARPAKDLLVTTSSGVYQFENNKLKKFDIPFKSPCFFYHEKGQAFVIGSNNEGIIAFDSETGNIVENSLANNLSENHVKTVLRDLQGNWWFGHPHSISHISQNSEEISYIRDSNFKSSYGYAGSCIAPDGCLYFAGNGGITVLNPQEFSKQEKKEDIPVFLDLIEINGEPVYPSLLGGNLELEHDENTLTFWFTALNLEEGATLTYEYSLVGHTKDWIRVGNTHRETFSNLKAGHYVFKVRARMPNGKWSKQEYSLPIYIKPAWWYTWWAQMFYLLLAVASLFFVLRLYTHWQIQKERLHLAQERIQYMMRHTTSTNLEEKMETLPVQEEPGNPEPVLMEKDRQFLENLYKVLDEHLRENELNVQQLAKEMLVSYSFLYNKVKVITGETPQHFLTIYRMNRAMELLKTKKYTVSDVSFMVGASSLANFSKGFKKQFGISPTEAMK
ncbi:MAG: helix-turn-helix domain-containing protein, partial [Bacteroidaceae bacterium]|nr:helix-turn-helix domain-containing protein [Bacteroidaceae bacterium]